MKKQTTPNIKAHLLRSTFYLLLLLAVGVIPFALGQRTARNQSPVADARLLGSEPTATPTQIQYHGGPLMLGTTNVYYIFYGNWSGNTATTILPFLADNIGGTAYFNINTTYYNGNGTHVSNSVAFQGWITDIYSQGNSLSDDAVRTIVTTAITGGNPHQSGTLPLDPNGIYFVLTSADVVETSGFCSQVLRRFSSVHERGRDRCEIRVHRKPGSMPFDLRTPDHQPEQQSGCRCNGFEHRALSRRIGHRPTRNCLV